MSTSSAIPISSGIPTVQMFTANSSWTKPAGLKYAIVQVQSAGGGGGNVVAGATQGNNFVGGSGGAGAYIESLLVESLIPSTVTLTVPGTTSSATTGGACSFGALLAVSGGAAGPSATGGNYRYPSTTGGNGGSVTASTGQIVYSVNGEPGEASYGFDFFSGITILSVLCGAGGNPFSEGTGSPTATTGTLNYMNGSGLNSVGLGGGGGGAYNLNGVDSTPSGPSLNGGTGGGGFIRILSFF